MSQSFTREIMVRFGDCDAAGMVYTGVIPTYVLRVIEDWWRDVIDLSWAKQNIETVHTTPFVHISLDFRAPIRVDRNLRVELKVSRLGRTSIRFGAEAYQNDILCFEGTFVEAFIDREKFLSTPMPANVMERIRAVTPAENDHSRD